MNNWANFFVAMAGGAAALTGLIFVGVSISLTKILSIPKMTGRAFGALIILLTALIASAICLIPDQSPFLTGAELFIIGVITWVLTLWNDLDMLKNAAPVYKIHYQINIGLTQLAVLPYIIAGAVTSSSGFDGIYWLVPGILMCFIKAIADAWVLLIEIHR